jgi:hypothetical protein
MPKFSSFFKNPVQAVSDTVNTVVEEVSKGTSSIDDFVNDEIPGGWATVALIAGGYYYQPEIQAWMAADGTVAATAEQVAATGLGEGATADQILTAALPEGSAYVAPTITDLGTVAGSTEGIASGTGLTAGSTGTGLTGTAAGGLAEMGGAQGLVSNATTSNLAAMGGGQGLTTAGALTAAGTPLTAGTVGAGGTALSGLTSGLATDATANAVMGAGGAGIGANILAGNLGTSAAATGVGSLLGDGAAASPANAIAAGTGAGVGTNLSGLLTPNNALIAKGILDAIGGDKVAGAISDAAATQQRAYETSKGDLSGLYTAQQGYQRPYMTTGAGALGNINALSTGPYTQYDYQGNPIGTATGSGYLQKQFDASDLAKGLAPNYDFMLQQGQMANQRAANMAGGGLGGNALQGLQKYTQDYAGNAYQNAFTNFQNQRQNIYNTLSNIAGIGQNATGQLAKTSDVYGTNLTNLNVGNAAAQAAAQVARAQTQGNTFSNLANTGVLASLLNQQPSVTG